MFIELKRLNDLRAAELPQVAAPWFAISWLKNAQSGYCHIRGFSDAWETCIQEQDPHRHHWNHRAQGFERLCAKIKQGDWVVVLDPSWTPLSPAYAQVNGQWQATQHVGESAAPQRLATQTKILERQQREQEALQSQNRPSSAAKTEPANGPGNRVATLGPEAGANANAVTPNTYGKSIKVEGDEEFRKKAIADLDKINSIPSGKRLLADID